MNSLGQVVGKADAAVGSAVVGHAFLQAAAAHFWDLTPGSQESVAYCINNNSQIVGGVKTASGTSDGMLWTVGGTTIDLGSAFIPTAINDQGVMGGLATQNQTRSDL